MSSTELFAAAPLPAWGAPFEAIVAAIVAHGHIAADLATIEALRRDPGSLDGRDLPASFLKHADEQSVCGFAAVLQAIARSGRSLADFREWGVVGAPQFPGRTHGGASIVRFFDQGVRGISPHAIPQNSLHSLSGVISVGLGMGGPNLGAGGGVRALAEGTMTALAVLAEGRLPGLWLVATAWDREPIPQKNGRVVAEGCCHAVALALTLAEEPHTGLCLALRCDDAAASRRAPRGATAPAFDSAISFAATVHAATQPRPAPAARDAVWGRHSLDWGAEIVVFSKHS